MNMQQMMKQAQEFQKKMSKIQDKLKQQEIEGAAGGSMVKIKINGKGNVLKIKIDKSLLVAEEVEMLEDLIVAAFNNAKEKLEEINKNTMSELGVPEGMLNNLGGGLY